MTGNIDNNVLYEAIRSRHSVRSFSSRPLGGDMLNMLNSYIKAQCKASEKIRIVIAPNSSEGIFKGLIGSYGVIKNASMYAAFIGDSSDSKTAYDVGYYGEMFILFAASEGLGTCWVSGTYKSNTVLKDITLQTGERVYAVTPLGYAADHEDTSHRLLKAFVGTGRRKTAEQISNIVEAGNQEWMRASAEALQLAPSTRNLQPWYAEFKPDEIRLHIKHNQVKGQYALDMGIAMLHLELGAFSCEKKGHWVYPNDNNIDVCRFVLQ